LLLFSGPVETPEDVQKLPPDVRQRFDQLQQSELPSIASGSAQNDDEDSDDGDDDADTDDDDSTPAPEQVSVTPQAFPRSLLPLHTILI